MIIADGHLDLGYNALQCNRNLLYSVSTIRVQEVGNKTGLPPNWGATDGTVALPEMRQGRIALCFATVLAASSGHPAPHMDYPSPLQAGAIARGQLAYYRLLEKEGFIRLISDLAMLDQHMAEWEAWDKDPQSDSTPPPPLGFVISMEGSDPILHPEELQEWWDLGLRMIIVAHFGPGRYAGGTGTELGLNESGLHLLQEMERLGILLDLTHFSDQAFWQALNHYGGPVLASHVNSRALVPSQRQFTDEQMKAVIERNGVIGTCADVWMLQPGWVLGVDTNEKVDLMTMVDHINHVCQLAGNSLHAAIGTDLDGGYGQKQSPRDLETIADLQKFNTLLASRGYTNADIANILYQNWVRLLRHSWARH
jgi:membrane dipeptidase